MITTETKKVSSFLKKTLVLIHSKQEFDKIVEDTQQQGTVQTKNYEEPHEKQKQMSEDIVVPRIGLVPLQKRLKSIPKLSKPIETHGYFRIRNSQILPNPEKYELTKSDMEFIRLLKKQYNFSKKYKLHSKTFIDIIETCEHNFYRHKTIKLHQESERYLQYLNFTMPLEMASFGIKEKDIIKKMILQIVDYWKKEKIQRDTFPLLRMYWPKSDLAMGKYSFWVPYKTRVVEEPTKKQGTLALMRNFGNTQKEKNLNRQVKDVTSFYLQVKDIADTQSTQHQRFKKEVSKFHKFAETYGLNPPEYFQEDIQKKPRNQYMKMLDKLGKSTYFRNPIVKLTLRSRFHYRPILQKTHEVSYNPQSREIIIKLSQKKIEQYETQMYLEQDMIGSDSEQNQMRFKMRKKTSRDLNFYCQKRNKGKKKVKIEY